MSSIDYHILRIGENAESISTLYFRPPGSFTNAIILKPEITNIIRDCDESERPLFKIEDLANKKNDQNKGIYNPEITRKLDRIIQLNADQSVRLDGVNIETLCDAINDFAKEYPIPGITEKTSQYHKEWHKLTESISYYEKILHTQEQRYSEQCDLRTKEQQSRETDDLIRTDLSISQQIEEMKKKIEQQKAELKQ